jgi:cytochrome c
MNMEFNKLFAALLTAGIAASLSGFIAEQLSEPKGLEKEAYHIEAMGGSAAAPVKEALPEPILAMIAAADVARGQNVAKACGTCHSFEKGGPNMTGPDLWGVIGRDKGSHAGFPYSDAMKSAPGNWTMHDIAQFIWKPQHYLPGTKMTFIGIKKPEDRAALIAWLRTQADVPAPLPTQADIAAEKAELEPAAPAEEVAPKDGTPEAAPAPSEAEALKEKAATDAAKDLKTTIEKAPDPTEPPAQGGRDESAPVVKEGK